MGFHIIDRITPDQLGHRYLDSPADLGSDASLAEWALVVEGEQDGMPMRVGEHALLQPYANRCWRIGRKAELLFYEQASELFLVSPLDQRPEYLRPYLKLNQAARYLKRGDFLLRDVGVEVEVKCRSVINWNEVPSVRFSYAEMCGLRNMELLTGDPMYLAVYFREAEVPAPQSLRMIALKQVMCADRTVVRYCHKTKSLVVPISLTEPRFDVLLGAGLGGR